MIEVAIVDSGVANIASVRSAFQSLGVATVVVRKPDEVDRATHIVVPGVGAFGPAAQRLTECGVLKALRRAGDEGRAVLGICLGFQLLGEGSDEAPGVAGAGLFPGHFERLPAGVPIPHLGWNRVRPAEPDPLLASGFAAFANSFALFRKPVGWAVSWTEHGRPFVSALRRGRVLGCQFHPELSGEFGLGLMQRWVEGRDAAPEARETVAESLSPPRGLPLRIVPCLDVRDGEVVKGIRFQGLRSAGDPVERARRYQEGGADELVVLDVGAAPESRATQLRTISDVRSQLTIPLTAGGGLRTRSDAARLLGAGADKVSVNTAAVEDPELVTRLAESFGCQCVVLAIDARRANGSWKALTVGGREASTRDAVEWARDGVERGAGEILLTSWDRDGTRRGCDLELLRAVASAVDVPVIASGGVGTRADVHRAYEAGASAVLAASIFHDGEDTPTGVKQYLETKGVPIRP